MIVKLFKKRWRLRFVRMKGKAHGTADAPHVKNKQIRVDRRLKGKKRLEIIIHEALHCCDWYRDEEWVEEAAHDLATLLWRIGYRHEKDQDDAMDV